MDFKIKYFLNCEVFICHITSCAPQKHVGRWLVILVCGFQLDALPVAANVCFHVIVVKLKSSLECDLA